MMQLIPPQADRIELFYKYRQDPITQRFNPLEPSSLEDIQTRLSIAKTNLQYWNTTGNFFWFLEQAGKVVGNVTLSQVNQNMLTAEIGYGIFPQWRGRGLAFQAVQELCLQIFAETPLRKLIAMVHEDNAASQHVLEKVGFKREGLLRQHYLIQGRPANEVIFGLLKDEFHLYS